MKITFSGSPVNSRVTTEVCREAMKFYAGLLMTPRLADSLEVQVRFINLRRRKNNGGVLATCWTEDCDPRPKAFFIEVQNDLGIGRTLRCLAHEMTHVKQEASGQFYQYVSCNKVRYNKEVYSLKDVNYWDMPHEIEAHGRECGLYRRFQNHAKLLKKRK